MIVTFLNELLIAVQGHNTWTVINWMWLHQATKFDTKYQQRWKWELDFPTYSHGQSSCKIHLAHILNSHLLIKENLYVKLILHKKHYYWSMGLEDTVLDWVQLTWVIVYTSHSDKGCLLEHVIPILISS